MKRYQNISTVTTSLMRKGASGEFKNETVRPGQIFTLTEDDISMTKDAYRPRENNPIDRKFIVEIPKGEDTHPDAPVLKRNPTVKQAADAMRSGVEDVAKVLAGIIDFRGLVIMRRALDQEREALTDSQFRDIDRLIDRRSNDVEDIQKENAFKFGTKV